jgi:hypothetical protein
MESKPAGECRILSCEKIVELHSKVTKRKNKYFMLLNYFDEVLDVLIFIALLIHIFHSNVPG